MIIIIVNSHYYSNFVSCSLFFSSLLIVLIIIIIVMIHQVTRMTCAGIVIIGLYIYGNKHFIHNSTPHTTHILQVLCRSTRTTDNINNKLYIQCPQSTR